MLLIVELMLEQYAVVQQPRQQAYECCPRRVFFECRWVLLLLLLLLLMMMMMMMLGARVTVTDSPRRARVCLSFSLRLSNRVISWSRVWFLRCKRPCLETYSSCSCARALLEQYASVQLNQHQAYECCSNRVLLLECCLVLLLLMMLLSVRVLVTTWPQDIREHALPTT